VDRDAVDPASETRVRGEQLRTVADVPPPTLEAVGVPRPSRPHPGDEDAGPILEGLAAELSVSMPATAAAEQMYAAALAQGHDEDFSVMIQFMEEMSGIKG